MPLAKRSEPHLEQTNSTIVNGNVPQSECLLHIQRVSSDILCEYTHDTAHTHTHIIQFRHSRARIYHMNIYLEGFESRQNTQFNFYFIDGALYSHRAACVGVRFSFLFECFAGGAHARPLIEICGACSPMHKHTKKKKCQLIHTDTHTQGALHFGKN